MKSRFAFLILMATAGTIYGAQYRTTGEYCASIVGDSYSLTESCVRRENEAQQRMNARRSQIDPNIWNYCWRLIGDSWSLMETCTQREMDAKGRLGK